MEKRLIKRTKIEVQLLGLQKKHHYVIGLASENSKQNIGPIKSQIEYHKNIISLRNQHKEEDEEELEEDVRKKEVEMYKVKIRGAKKSDKEYCVEIPITHHRAISENKTLKQFFTLWLESSRGSLQLLRGVYDAQLEVHTNIKKELTFKQKYDIQNSKLDNRRKQDLTEAKVLAREKKQEYQ